MHNRFSHFSEKRGGKNDENSIMCKIKYSYFYNDYIILICVIHPCNSPLHMHQTLYKLLWYINKSVNKKKKLESNLSIANLKINFQQKQNSTKINK